MSEMNKQISLTCAGCGHQHTGTMWGHICIGCPCALRPGAEPQALPGGASPEDDPRNGPSRGIPVDSPEGQKALYAMLRAQQPGPIE